MAYDEFYTITNFPFTKFEHFIATFQTVRVLCCTCVFVWRVESAEQNRKRKKERKKKCRGVRREIRRQIRFIEEKNVPLALLRIHCKCALQWMRNSSRNKARTREREREISNIVLPRRPPSIKGIWVHFACIGGLYVFVLYTHSFAAQLKFWRSKKKTVWKTNMHTNPPMERTKRE